MSEILKLVVGKSGSGKNYICDKNNWKSIPSYTTRPMRVNETEGKEHYFVTKNDYNWYFRHQTLPAYTIFAGNHYWTTTEQFENKKYDTYIIDPKGVFWCLELIHVGSIKRDVEIIYIDCSLYKRFYRMMKRGDSIKNVIKRLTHDEDEFESFFLKLKRYQFNHLNIKIIKN